MKEMVQGKAQSLIRVWNSEKKKNITRNAYAYLKH